MNIDNSNRQGISHIPYICKALGIKHVVLCPGSRNAPLIMAFGREEGFDLYSITDERSAGYFALGLGQVSQQPVAVVCTSGTAVLNLAPAVAEAYYQCIPLVVLTADRPIELIDQGDGQTIHQRNIFGPHVKFSTELPTDTSLEADLWLSDRLVSQAIVTAAEHPKGPVHINIPLREPLFTPLPQLANPKIIITAQRTYSLANIDHELISHTWNKAEKKMIVVGGMATKNIRLNELLEKLSQRSDTLVIAENLSNVSHPNFIYDPEKFLAALPASAKAQLQPHLLIT
ncbi:MAG: 2-succinyl-5-enolpyruvyl-6-hydroxy-3-cyclohexene-1-carboxylic-acid synthase, partial [Bacteroidales bacterium]